MILACSCAAAVSAPAAAGEKGLALTYISTATKNTDGTYLKRMGVKLPLLSETAFGVNIGFAGRLYAASGRYDTVSAPASVVWGRVKVSGADTLPLWDTSTLALSMTPRDDNGRVNWTNTRRWKVDGGQFVASLDDRYWVDVRPLDDDPMLWGAGTTMRLEAKSFGTVVAGGLDHLSGNGTFVANLSAEQTVARTFKLGAAVTNVLDAPVATFSAEKRFADHLVITASLSDNLEAADDEPVKVLKASYSLKW
ncbi:hypothetical protein [Breoghania sp. JC706]|uniref:hypothetical protein n=1 Tax=Breoghania sp. JC706 TaxID=3117732 RepID=UPI00300ADD18